MVVSLLEDQDRANNSEGEFGFLVLDKVLRNITIHNKSDELELMWIRLELANKTPLYVGLYCSYQESRTEKKKAEENYQNITSEIKPICKWGRSY